MIAPFQDLFIIEDNALTAIELQKFLKGKFGNELNIFTFENGATALQNINNNTSIVIIDFDLVGEIAENLLVDIKKINPKTEVIILSSNEDIGAAIDSFRKGANSIVIKGKNVNSVLESKIYKIITYPADLLVKTLGVNKMLALFLLCITYIGIVVYIGMRLLN